MKLNLQVFKLECHRIIYVCDDYFIMRTALLCICSQVFGFHIKVHKKVIFDVALSVARTHIVQKY